MTGFFPGGGSPFDQFLAQFFGNAMPGRRPQSVDITRLLTDQARELISEAAEKAAEQGRADVDTEHLLWAATQVPVTRQLLENAGAKPDALAGEVGGQPGAERTTPTALAPGAKRALLDAHGIARSMGSSYIGPQHLLLALAVNPQSAAGRILARAGADPQSLQSPPPDARSRAVPAHSAAATPRRWTSSAGT